VTDGLEPVGGDALLDEVGAHGGGAGVADTECLGCGSVRR